MIKQVLYFGNRARLSTAHRQLCIELQPANDGKPPPIVTRPLEDIGVVVIDSREVTMTASVMQGLAENGAALIVCGPNHLPTGLMLNIDGHCEQTERMRHQLEAPLPLRKQLWQQTVKAKILNQASAAHKVHGAEVGCMTAWARSVRSGDPDNMEGKAAAYYWRVMLSDYDGVTRDRYGADPNPLFNYGYAILRGITARAVVSAGLHPSMGIFHRNKYNAYCLADDLMEPYRPYVDLTVMDICRRYEQPSLECKDVKRDLLAMTTCDVKIDGHIRPLMLAVGESAVSLYKCFSGSIKQIHYPEL